MGRQALCWAQWYWSVHRLWKTCRNRRGNWYCKDEVLSLFLKPPSRPIYGNYNCAVSLLLTSNILVESTWFAHTRFPALSWRADWFIKWCVSNVNAQRISFSRKSCDLLTHVFPRFLRVLIGSWSCLIGQRIFLRFGFSVVRWKPFQVKAINLH